MKLCHSINIPYNRLVNASHLFLFFAGDLIELAYLERGVDCA